MIPGDITASGLRRTHVVLLSSLAGVRRHWHVGRDRSHHGLEFAVHGIDSGCMCSSGILALEAVDDVLASLCQVALRAAICIMHFLQEIGVNSDSVVRLNQARFEVCDHGCMATDIPLQRVEAIERCIKRFEPVLCLLWSRWCASEEGTTF